MKLRLPSPALIISCLALVVALGGTAIAAGGLGSGAIKNNSIKSVDFKNGAGVTGADVAANSLTGGDLGARSLGGADFADNSLGGGSIDESSLSVSRVIAHVGGQIDQPLTSGITYQPVPNRTFIQGPDTSVQISGGVRVTFDASCASPRSVAVYETLDDPTLNPATFIGFANLSDNTSGTVTRNVAFSSFPGGLPNTLIRRGTAKDHELFFYATGSCGSGSGVTLNSVGADVIGNR